MRWVIMPAETASPWLTIIGVGEDGLDGLGSEAKRCIAAAEVVFGAKRHLALVGDAIPGEARAWPTPFDAEMHAVAELRGRNVWCWHRAIRFATASAPRWRGRFAAA